MAANVDACIMCCPLNHHTKGLLGAKVSVLIFVLICAVVLGLVCVLICALYGCLSFCVSYVHMCPYMCPYVCPYMQYVVFSMVQHTHTHTHTPGCERCPRVRLLLLYSLLVLNYFTLYYPLPNYSTFTHTHTPGDGNDAQGCAYRECGARRYRPYADRLSYPLYHCSLLYSLLGCAHLYYRPMPTTPLYHCSLYYSLLAWWGRDVRILLCLLPLFTTALFTTPY